MFREAAARRTARDHHSSEFLATATAEALSGPVWSAAFVTEHGNLLDDAQESALAEDTDFPRLRFPQTLKVFALPFIASHDMPNEKATRQKVTFSFKGE
jgi:hypothetical protein